MVTFLSLKELDGKGGSLPRSTVYGNVSVLLTYYSLSHSQPYTYTVIAGILTLVNR